MSTSDSPAVPGTIPRTEARHDTSIGLDTMTSLEILDLLNAEDSRVALAVQPTLPRIAELVDIALATLQGGGAIHYFGAGTSGRLAVLDAAELVPTFNLEQGRIVAHIAGGAPALLTAVEGSEDSHEDGGTAAADLTPTDLAIGIAASGTTPYVAAALTEARSRGTSTALVTSNPDSPLAPLADVLIVADTGPEVLTGSTRLKAGTAAKLVLNGFSTALMIRYGRTWSNLMVSLVASNRKLRDRSVRILVEATDLAPAEAEELLIDADGDLKAALVSALTGASVSAASAALAQADGSARAAIALIGH